MSSSFHSSNHSGYGDIAGIHLCLLYIVLSAFATLWIGRWGQSELASGLHYIAFVTGKIMAAQIGGRLMDRLWNLLKQSSGEGKTAPEYRIPLMLPGVVLVPTGPLVYGWAAQRRFTGQYQILALRYSGAVSFQTSRR